MRAALTALLFLCSASIALAQNNRPGTFAEVREFGAVGDGEADDTKALEKAIASGRGVVRIPKGKFRITRSILIELDKTGYIAIEGHGVGQIVMAGAGPALKF